MKRTALLLLTILFLSNVVGALKIGGKSLPDTMTLGDTELVLNGAGLRKKLVIKVYAGALYLPKN